MTFMHVSAYSLALFAIDPGMFRPSMRSDLSVRAGSLRYEVGGRRIGLVVDSGRKVIVGMR
jgi:hypothetical protein